MQFADDIALYSKILPIKRCENLVEKSIHIIKDNLRSLGLELSAQKTKLIQFSKISTDLDSILIKIDEHIIKPSDQVCFLGMIFDPKLTFQLHIRKVKKKCL